MELETVSDPQIEVAFLRDREFSSNIALSNLAIGAGIIGLVLELQSHQNLDPLSASVIGGLFTFGIVVGNLTETGEM